MPGELAEASALLVVVLAAQFVEWAATTKHQLMILVPWNF